MDVAIIPARGGSKRIPRKNIKLFKGKPIIYWSINKAIKSNCFDRVIVSTDDIEIAEVAKNYGAEVPFIRPKNLADDFTNTSDVIKHSISWLEDSDYHFKNVCCIYPTAPLIFSSDILKAKDLIDKSKEGILVFTATSFSFPIQRAIYLDSKGFAKMFNPELFETRSQDLIDSYHDAGQFYWAPKSIWIKKKNLFENSKPIVIPRWRVQDIDNLEDWERAELIFDLISKK